MAGAEDGAKTVKQTQIISSQEKRCYTREEQSKHIEYPKTDKSVSQRTKTRSDQPAFDAAVFACFTRWTGRGASHSSYLFPLFFFFFKCTYSLTWMCDKIEICGSDVQYACSELCVPARST